MLSRLLTLVLLAGFCTLAQQDFSYGDSILAIVGEKVITAYEVMQASAREEAQLSRTLSSSKRMDEIVAIRRRILSRMIDHELVYLEFQNMKAKVPENVLQERLDQAIVMQTGGDRAKFEELLYREHKTMKDFTDQMSKNIAVDMLLYDRVNRGIMISPAKIQAYFQANASRFQQATKYNLDVILLKKEGRYKGKLDETVKEIYGKLGEGNTFAELAKTYSEGANGSQGGNQGWMSNMNVQLLDLVKSLAVGEVAGKPLDLGNSLYIVRLVDAVKGTNSLTPEIREQIRNILTSEEEGRRYDKFLRELRLKYPFKRMDGAQ